MPSITRCDAAPLACRYRPTLPPFRRSAPPGAVLRRRRRGGTKGSTARGRRFLVAAGSLGVAAARRGRRPTARLGARFCLAEVPRRCAAAGRGGAPVERGGGGCLLPRRGLAAARPLERHQSADGIGGAICRRRPGAGFPVQPERSLARLGPRAALGGCGGVAARRVGQRCRGWRRLPSFQGVQHLHADRRRTGGREPTLAARAAASLARAADLRLATLLNRLGVLCLAILGHSFAQRFARHYPPLRRSDVFAGAVAARAVAGPARAELRLAPPAALAGIPRWCSRARAEGETNEARAVTPSCGCLGHFFLCEKSAVRALSSLRRCRWFGDFLWGKVW